MLGIILLLKTKVGKLFYVNGRPLQRLHIQHPDYAVSCRPDALGRFEIITMLVIPCFASAGRGFFFCETTIFTLGIID